ncbi:MAG: hypothetical protein ACKO7W_00590, partial [Elainella sp.]
IRYVLVEAGRAGGDGFTSLLPESFQSLARFLVQTPLSRLTALFFVHPWSYQFSGLINQSKFRRVL